MYEFTHRPVSGRNDLDAVVLEPDRGQATRGVGAGIEPDPTFVIVHACLGRMSVNDLEPKMASIPEKGLADLQEVAEVLVLKGTTRSNACMDEQVVAQARG